jgi:hypothetical protein
MPRDHPIAPLSNSPQSHETTFFVVLSTDYSRLEALGNAWGCSPDEALTRVLDEYLSKEQLR